MWQDACSIPNLIAVRYIESSLLILGQAAAPVARGVEEKVAYSARAKSIFGATPAASAIRTPAATALYCLHRGKWCAPHAINRFALSFRQALINNDLLSRRWGDR
jgi:hypothetical protein